MEVPKEVVKLVYEEVLCPELLVPVLLGQVRRFSSPELVVEDDDGARVGEVCEGEEVVVAHSWSAVNHDERTLRRLLEITKDLAVREAGLVHAVGWVEWDFDLVSGDGHGE